MFYEIGGPLVEIVVDDDQIGKMGDMVPSTKSENPEKHFVTPKKNNSSDDLNKEFVVLKLNTVLSAAAFDQSYEWEIPSGKGEVDSSNHLKCKIHRYEAAKIEVKVKKKSGMQVMDKLNVWVVWATPSDGYPKNVQRV